MVSKENDIICISSDDDEDARQVRISCYIKIYIIMSTVNS